MYPAGSSTVPVHIHAVLSPFPTGTPHFERPHYGLPFLPNYHQYFWLVIRPRNRKSQLRLAREVGLLESYRPLIFGDYTVEILGRGSS